MRKKPKIMLHMHQIRDFIDDRHSFMDKYFNNIEPAFYQWKGVQKAFQVGTAVDYGIKQFYLNLNKISDGAGDVNPGDDVLNCHEFKTLPSKTDQAIVMGLINSYISRYNSTEKTKEYFHNFKVVNYTIPFIFYKNARVKSCSKHEYVIYSSPDLVAETYFNNDLVILEIKTSGEDGNKYNAETLDFQTMTYCWGSYRWNFKVPVGVIKRTLMKPRIRIKKNETESEFVKRLVTDMAMNEDKYFKTGYREVTKEMVLEYEKYLAEILLDLDSCFVAMEKKNKYKFWKKSNEYWGL